MRWGIMVLAIALLITLVWVSGCANLSLGTTQVADFGGNSVNAQQAQSCFINKYGNPVAYTGPSRFLEPMVSDGISNNTPMNKVTKFSKDTPSVYAWAFYEGFKPGDQIAAAWTFNGKQFASLAKPVAGNYGLVYGQFDMPKSGWALGTHTITISSNGVQGSATFDIIDGKTETVPLPCKEAQGGSSGQPGNVVTPLPNAESDKAKLLQNNPINTPNNDKRSVVTILTDVEKATHGETRTEVLGSGMGYVSGEPGAGANTIESAPVLSKPGCANQGWTDCGYQYCTNLAYDDNNCGKCGYVCTNGNICLEGYCDTIEGFKEKEMKIIAAESKLDGMNEMSEMTSLRLQMTMDRRSKFIATLSNIMKKIGTTQEIVSQNIK